MAEEFDFNAWIEAKARKQDFDSLAAIRREAAGEPPAQIAIVAEHAVTFLRAAEAAYKRRTGRELSPDTASALILWRTALKSNLG
jgi:hypothetical protein